MNVEYEYVVKTSRLEQIVKLCRAKSAVAIDTEFARFNTYYPIVGLVQIFDGDSCYLIDPLAIEDISCLADLMSDLSVVKVLHACSEDMEVFQHSLGVAPLPVVDSQIAAAVLGVGFSISYQNLVEHYLSLRIEKDETRSDWLKRPLTSAQMDYAALDVIHLLEVYEKQKLELEERNRSQWLTEECANLSKNIATLIEPEAFYLKLGNLIKLNRSQLNVLKLLCAWREKKARQLNVPRNRVIEGKSLYLLAQNKLVEKESFKAGAQISPRDLRKFGDELFKVINEALQVAEQYLPPAQEKPKIPLSSQLLKSLKQVVETRSIALNIAPELLAKRRHLEQLLRSVDGDGRYYLPAAFMGWREEAIGKDLLASLPG